VDDFLDAQLPAEREHWLMKLGVRVGERFGEYHPKLASASDVATVLETAVVPALKSVAVATPFGSDLRITDNIFLRRNLDMLLLPISDQPRGCFFIAGLIQGMVNKAPQLPHLCVTETKCQELGDPACYYEISDQ
jgi:predicted hydrocarbon binding protein